MDLNGKSIVFYDGNCGFCNRTVQFVLNHEKGNDIYFTPIQTEFTNRFFIEKEYPLPDLSTFYFYTKGELYSKSTGIFELLRLMKFPYPLLRVFVIVPKILRDYVYDLIAKRRQRISPSYCFLPNIEQKKRFISD